MKCEKCLYKDLFNKLEKGYEIIARDDRAVYMEVVQKDKKGDEVYWSSILFPKKPRNVRNN